MHRRGRRDRRESQYYFASRKGMHPTNRGSKNQPAMVGRKYKSFEETGGNLSAISAPSAVNYSGQGMHTAKFQHLPTTTASVSQGPAFSCSNPPLYLRAVPKFCPL
jgi:hypothetical protein